MNHSENKQPIDQRNLMRDREAASYLGVGVSTVWMFSRQKKIKAIKLSPRITVWSKADLDEYVQSCMKTA
ncbi:helix-turn-helix domain-containing protein [Sulfuricurvum sp.]|uniref:helix-turn-helix transcriptional regulator n=1 Tax=Sulfuricurvum sp. TaxID=2025608 RepID=UPI002633A2E8|nr:helix-turn-helix domain-containing protein [Sulfuricurvum sp.]MDD2782297.1 helix-turn-helix domain-containing protein [Sulfuricurvum sp.]